jgi:hypothetical protein
MKIDTFRNNKSPLLLEGWIEYNKIKWGVTPLDVSWSYDGKERPNINAVFYLDKKGKIVHPPLNPYIGLEFQSTSTKKTYSIYNQWQKASDFLSKKMKDSNLATMIMFPPGIEDMRSWVWDRFLVGVKYTYVLNFPYAISEAQSEVRTNIRKAIKNGFVAERSNSLDHVYECLLSTEKRKDFSHQLTLDDLRLLHELLGEDHLRSYVCYAPNGEVASASICIYCDNGYAIGWVRGTKEEYLNSGTAMYLDQIIIDDLQDSKAKGIDFCGANIRSVEKAKRQWGAELVPFYSIEKFGLFTIAKTLKNMLVFNK